jgi:hypothetical protein
MNFQGNRLLPVPRFITYGAPIYQGSIRTHRVWMAISTDYIAAFVLGPELGRSAVRMAAGVLSVRIARCNESSPELKLDKICRCRQHSIQRKVLPRLASGGACSQIMKADSLFNHTCNAFVLVIAERCAFSRAMYADTVPISRCNMCGDAHSRNACQERTPP